MENSCSCLLLMKIGKEEFMDDLLKKGIIYMNTTKYFRDHPNPEIGDSFEGALIVQNGKVVEWRKDIDKEKLYCMWHINNATSFECYSAGYDEKTNQSYIIYNLNKYGAFSDNTYLIIVRDIQEFNRRIEKACMDIGLVVNRTVVKYFDENCTSSKEISAFMKRKKYSHQQEVRYLVQNNDSEPLKLEIGSIEDIAVKYTAQSAMKLIVTGLQKTESNNI